MHSEITLSSGHIALFDSDYLDRRGAKNLYALPVPGKRGPGRVYVAVSVEGAIRRAHRDVLALAEDDNRVVDHINGNTLDNRRSNLQVCLQYQNVHRSLKAKASSGFIGVSKRSDSRNFQARLNVNGRRYELGCFQSPFVAAYARDIVAMELLGSFASLNGISAKDLDAYSAELAESRALEALTQ